MKINAGDVFKFPNGKYQYKIKFFGLGLVCVYKYIDNIELGCLLGLQKTSPFFCKRNKIYDNKTGEWFFQTFK